MFQYFKQKQHDGVMGIANHSKNRKKRKRLMSRDMAKFFICLLLVSLSLSTTSCIWNVFNPDGTINSANISGRNRGGGSNSPSSVVKKTWNAYIQKNYDEYLKYWHQVPFGLTTEAMNEFMNTKLTLFDIELDRTIHDLGPVKFEIQNERIFNNGEKAEVIAKFFYKEGEVHTFSQLLVKTSSGWKFTLDPENFAPLLVTNR